MDLKIAGLAWDFIDYAVQYFLLGRIAASTQMFEVSGWMFHTSVEYLLKGALIHKFGQDRLKADYGHRLLDLWAAWVKEYKFADSGVFAEDIKKLSAFRIIRYPDGKDLISMRIAIKLNSDLDEQDKFNGTSYTVDIIKIDSLAEKILTTAQRPPSFYFSKYRSIFPSLVPPLPLVFTGKTGEDS